MKTRIHWVQPFQKTPYHLVVGAVFMCVVAGMVLMERNSMQANYTALLTTIARGESHGNYNAYFGHTNNRTIDFTTMPVRQVLSWQQRYTATGQPSNAVGKYQFIYPTLKGLVEELHINEDELFSPALQDRLAIKLIQRRGLVDFMRGRISREEFAHNLSREWAALPRVLGDNPNASYYAGDGLNQALISVHDTLAAIDSLRLPSNS